ncbi:MAG: helix-turn-helix transcriptional regulator [bacterium]|nr:helix-turn-helix transcriptional regulator [bacterium]
MREMLGLTQDQLGRIAGVSQGAVSRLEMGVGLATPFLVVVKVQRALQRLLGRIDAAMLSDEARRLLADDSQVAHLAREGVPPDFPLFGDPGLEELVRTYQGLSPARREQFLAVVRAAALAFRDTSSLLPPSTRGRA